MEAWAGGRLKIEGVLNNAVSGKESKNETIYEVCLLAWKVMGIIDDLFLRSFSCCWVDRL